MFGKSNQSEMLLQVTYFNVDLLVHVIGSRWQLAHNSFRFCQISLGLQPDPKLLQFPSDLFLQFPWILDHTYMELCREIPQLYCRPPIQTKLQAGDNEGLIQLYMMDNFSLSSWVSAHTQIFQFVFLLSHFICISPFQLQDHHLTQEKKTYI